MKVMIYKKTEQGRQILIIPGRAAHKPPIMIRGQDKKQVLDELLDVLDSLAPGAEQISLGVWRAYPQSGTRTVTSERTPR